jgi:small multidrug resistance family-3 protein
MPNEGALVYGLAASEEIAGCFALWAWLRLGRFALWILPGLMSLAAFAFLLTRVDVALAGRVFAAYGGISIAASVLLLWVGEGQRPDTSDFVGAGASLLGAAIILLTQRAPE